MPHFFIARAFRLTRDDGSFRYFPAGLQRFSDNDEDTKHWYFKANAQNPDSADFEVGVAPASDMAEAVAKFASLEMKRAKQQENDPRYKALAERSRVMAENAFKAVVAEAEETKVLDRVRRGRPPKG